MAEPTLLTEEEMVALVQSMVAEKGVRGLARELKLHPGDVHRVKSERKGPGKAVPAAMGYEIRYLKVS